ncbi:hypothetical protein MUP79_08705 [Candidatus Bathyarchaeota archaeon]|nr:hypothetical protein [Candidatus Bathyarchaeota archaeon]
MTSSNAKATRHQFSPELNYLPNVVARLLRLEVNDYLNYEMRCHDHHVEPLRLDQWQKRGDEREQLWGSQVALEDSKEADELRKARAVTRELAPKLMLDQILHHLSILNRDGTIIKDLSVLSCPRHGVKDWEKWCRDNSSGSNVPTYEKDKEKVRKFYETIFSDAPDCEHSTLYCWKETDVVPEYQPKSPRFPRFTPMEKGPCTIALTSNYWRFLRRN